MKRLLGICLLALAWVGMVPEGSYDKRVSASGGTGNAVVPFSSLQTGPRDGDLVVAQPGSVINRYAVLATDVAVGASTLTVTYPGGEYGLQASDLAAGDVILVVQMAGAAIDNQDRVSYGEVLDYKQSGLYEYLTISRVVGGVITVRPPCGGTLNSYEASGRTQVIRVPRYRSLRVEGTGSIVAPAWNGGYGGIVAAIVEGEAVISGQIDVSGRGFRGGAGSLLGASERRAEYLTSDPNVGAEKGEGIAGDATTYDALGGRYGRGAAANGGGGGTAHNAGGGGGANGQNGQTWTGQGVMDSSVVGSSAWALDPGYQAAGGQLTRSSGGGRGGYTYAEFNANALISGPDEAAWGGDRRREVGGLGGRPTPQDPANRLFMGGGGGAGAQNDRSGGAGGAAGGIIYLIANTLRGSGQLLATGAPGEDTHFENRDGAGGGGAGGTIVLITGSLSGVRAVASGGRGGIQRQPIQPNPQESQGPGGGGGGGFIAYTGGTINTDVSGGQGGVSESPSLTEFPSNGATSGSAGQVVTSVASIPFCQTASDLAVTMTNPDSLINPGTPTTYTITVSNLGPNHAYGAIVENILPAEFTAASKRWTCQATAGSSCAASSGVGDLVTTVDLRNGGFATLTVTAALDPTSSISSITNRVVVTPAAGAVEVNSSNNTAAAVNQVIARSDLRIAKTGAPRRVFGGGRIVYTITVSNQGPDPAIGARVEDTVSLELLNPQWTCTAGAGATCGAPSGTGRIATTVNLGAGASATFRMEALVSLLAKDTLNSETTITAGPRTLDPDLTNNVARTSNVVLPTGGMTIFPDAGQTTLTFVAPWLENAAAEGVVVGPLAPATRRNQSIVLPVANGGFHLPSARAEVGHQGGWVLVKDSVQLIITAVHFDTTGDEPVLTGYVTRSGNPAVNGSIEILGRIPLYTLALPTLPLPYPPTSRSVFIRSIGAQSTAELVSLLSASFGSTRFRAGELAGEITIQMTQR